MSRTLFTGLSDGVIRLAPLTRFNWEECLGLEVEQSQRNHLPSILHSIAQSKFEACTPCGIFSQGTLCGFLLFCQFQQACWITRVMVDRRWQRQGIGGRAVALAIRHLQSHPGCREIRTSVAGQNFAALQLFRLAGFVPIGDEEGDEVVMRFRG